MASHVHSMGHHHGMHAHSAVPNISAMAMAATTMSMILGNITMGQDMDHSMHNMTMKNTTGMGQGMGNDTMGHGMHGMPGVTDPPGGGHHHDHGSASDSGMGHDHGGMAGVTDPPGGGHHHDHGSATDSGTGHDHGDMGHDHGAHTDGMDHGSHTDGTHGGHDQHGAAGHTMSMYFNQNLPLHVLFFGWEVTSQGQLAGACVAWLVLSIVYEGLKSLREYILGRSVQSERKYLVKANRNGSSGDTVVTEPSCLKRMFSGSHILLSLLQIVQTTLGMFLMLVYMTFNVWLALSVSLGSGLGYFFFAWNKKSSSQFDDDHCV